MGELDVSLPELLLGPVIDVGAQHVGAFGKRRPAIELVARADPQRKAGRVVAVGQRDLEASGGAGVALQKPADLPIDLGLVEGLLGVRDAAL